MDKWPAFVALTSTHNIPIENLWSRFQKFNGKTIKKTLMEGHSNHVFTPGHQSHVYVFYIARTFNSPLIIFKGCYFSGCGHRSSRKSWIGSVIIGIATMFALRTAS